MIYAYAAVDAIVALCFACFMPKRLTRTEIYTTWTTMAGLALYIDFLFVLVFKLYDQGTPEVDWQVLSFEPVLGPAFGVIFLNFMPLRRRSFFIYLIGVVIPVSLVNELLAVRFGYITYKHWNIGFSAIVYTIGMLFLRWHLWFIRLQTK